MTNLLRGQRRDDWKPPQPGERSGCWATAFMLAVGALVTLGGIVGVIVEGVRAVL